MTPQAIGGYHAAMEKLLLDTDTTLVLDGGRTRLTMEGREYICKTVLDGDTPTVEKCHELMEKLAQYHCFPQTITLYLPNRTVWDYDAPSDRLTRRECEGTAPIPSDPLLLE